jgi:signal recognition particle receptor subunit beta
MAKMSHETAAVNARIVYWGIEGAGKSTNLRSAFAKLRPDHRGTLREESSRLDPTIGYEILPITLGEVAGIRTQIELISVPGRPDQGPMRKQLLDQVDGIVLVLDASAPMQENLATVDELHEVLAAYGRSLSDLPVAVQYNKRDLADPYALEDLHRKLDLGGAPVFEAVATEGTGVLQTLSTISKRVIRALREADVAAEPGPEPAPAPSPPTPAERMEQAIGMEQTDPEAPALDAAVEDAQTLLDTSFDELAGEIERPAGVRLGPDVSIVSVGEAVRVGDRSLRVPLVLGDPAGGTSTLVLTIQLDALVEEDPG